MLLGRTFERNLLKPHTATPIRLYGIEYKTNAFRTCDQHSKTDVHAPIKDVLTLKKKTT